MHRVPDRQGQVATRVSYQDVADDLRRFGPAQGLPSSVPTRAALGEFYIQMGPFVGERLSKLLRLDDGSEDAEKPSRDANGPSRPAAAG